MATRRPIVCAGRLSPASATAARRGGGDDAGVLPSVDPAVSHPSKRPCQRRPRPAPGGRHLYRRRSTATAPQPARVVDFSSWVARTGRLIASSMSGVALRRTVDAHRLVDCARRDSQLNFGDYLLLKSTTYTFYRRSDIRSDRRVL